MAQKKSTVIVLNQSLSTQTRATPTFIFTVCRELVSVSKRSTTAAKQPRRPRRGGQLKGAQNAAFKEAMRGFQDEFSREVAMSSGLIEANKKAFERVGQSLGSLAKGFIADMHAPTKKNQKRSR